MKKFLAALTAAVLGLGVGAGAITLPAFATSLPSDATAVASNATAPSANSENFWETLTGEVCTKYEPVDVVPYTLVAPPSGFVYSKLIIKAGSSSSVDHENYVWYPPNIIVGAQYQHQEKDSISHLILCVVPTDIPVTITVGPSATEPTCDEAGSLVVPVTANVSWTGGSNGDGPGSYTLVAHAATGYVISGTSSFPVEVLDQLEGEECDNDLPVTITVLPSATVPTCDLAGSLVVPVTANVSWTGGSNGDGPGSYTLVAHAATGYVISGTSSFPVEVLDKLEGEQCDKLAGVVGDPVPTEAACAIDEESSSTDGFYTIHEAEGVGYYVHVNAVLVATITSTFPYGPVIFSVTSYPSLVEIQAFALPGYFLDGEVTSFWSHTFLFNERLCNLKDLALVTPVVDQDPPTCTLSGRFFLGGDGVEWLTSPGGVPVAAGWHNVPSVTTLTFQAVPGPDNGFADDTQTVFEFEFLASPLECLDTLAFTGNEGVPLFLGGAAALLLLGAASIFFTRRRTL